MAVQHLRVDPVSHPPQQRRRALNVGEQKHESLHGHSVEAPPGCGPASSHTITPDLPTRMAPRLLTGLADHPHGRAPIANAPRRQNKQFGAALAPRARSDYHARIGREDVDSASGPASPLPAVPSWFWPDAGVGSGAWVP